MRKSKKIFKVQRKLSLPEVMARLGYADHLKKVAFCPFHNDSHPSFSVFPKDGDWFWKCFKGCGEGYEIDFVAKYLGDLARRLTATNEVFFDVKPRLPRRKPRVVRLQRTHVRRVK